MSAEHSTRLEELLPAYALGALDDSERLELEAHLLSGCPVCRGRLALFYADVEELAELASPVAPSPAVRSRILEAARGTASAVPFRGLAALWPFLAAALLLVAVWSGVEQASLRGEVRRLTAQAEGAARRADDLDRQARASREESARLARTLSIVAVPGVQSVALAGLASAPAAQGHAFVDARDGKALFYAFDLKPLPPGRTYQLWFIAAGHPVSAGIFSVDRQGNGSVQVERVAPAAQIQAWAVTIEPAGGVPQPTGTMVLKG